jgi:hypothetical protein
VSTFCGVEATFFASGHYQADARCRRATPRKGDQVMRKLILATASAIALFGVAACSDSGVDETTTQSVKPPVTEPAPATPETMAPADQPMQPKPEAPATAPQQ